MQLINNIKPIILNAIGLLIFYVFCRNCRDCTKTVFDVLKNEPYFKQRVYQVEKVRNII